jgi:hypothetical protein
MFRQRQPSYEETHDKAEIIQELAWSDGCLMYSGQIASTLFRNQQRASLTHQKRGALQP